jgi:hypothetical protein
MRRPKKSNKKPKSVKIVKSQMTELSLLLPRVVAPVDASQMKIEKLMIDPQLLEVHRQQQKRRHRTCCIMCSKCPN